MYTANFLKLGMELEGGCSSDFRDADFCSARFLRAEDVVTGENTYVLTPMAGKFLARAGLCTKTYKSQEEYMNYFLGVCVCQGHNFGHVPVVRMYLQQCIKLLDGRYKPWIPHDQEYWCSYESNYRASENTFTDFTYIYGVTFDQVIGLEELILTIQSLPCLLISEDVQLIIDRDVGSE